MKTFKIIIGLILLYSIGNEYINASRQLSTFLSPSIIIVFIILIIPCAWLIGSGLSRNKLKLKSIQFAKYYGISFGIFLIMACFSLLTFNFDPEIVKVNGIDVNIAEFMNGTKRLIPDEKQRREYCLCVVTKLTQDKELLSKHMGEFESGKFSNIILALQTDTGAYKYNLSECNNFLDSIKSKKL